MVNGSNRGHMPDVSASGGFGNDMLAALGGSGGTDLLNEVLAPQGRGASRVVGNTETTPARPSGGSSFRSIGQRALNSVQDPQGEISSTRRSFDTRSPFNRAASFDEPQAEDGEDDDDNVTEPVDTGKPAPKREDKGDEPPEWYHLLNNDNQMLKDQLSEIRRSNQEVISHLQRPPQAAPAPTPEPTFEIEPEHEQMKAYVDHQVAAQRQLLAQTVGSVHAHQAIDKVGTAYAKLASELPEFDKYIPRQAIDSLVGKAVQQNPTWAASQNWENEMRNGYRAARYDALVKENDALKKQVSVQDAKKQHKKETQKEKLQLVPPVSGGDRSGTVAPRNDLFAMHPRDRRKRDMRAFGNLLKVDRARTAL